jgi:hypothetical protein
VPELCQNPPEYGGKLPESAPVPEGGFGPHTQSFAGLFASTPRMNRLLAMQKAHRSTSVEIGRTLDDNGV